MKKIFTILLLVLLISCKDEKPQAILTTPPKPKIIQEFGFKLNNFKVINDTIKPGENFSEILDRNHIEYPRVLEIVNKIRDTFNVRRIKSGIPYTILAKNDTTEQAQVFIYQHSKVRYTVIDFRDSIPTAYNGKKPVKTVIKTASGVITSHLSEAIESQGLSSYLTYKMADDIYAWTIDFSRLQKNDKFKLIYEQLYINDTIPVGIGEIKAAYFEHGGKPFYAFKYVADSILNIPDYFDDEATNLRRQFLKMPVKFSRISSRYNLKRRIAYYGNKVRPHKGTDFAASIGTEIMATANGTVTESRRKGGNGNYVKIRHNGTYSTQYLHMSRRAVKVGDVVKQGDVIGYIGMTGNTAGPHVCYRFWKNGVQVDPLKQKLPAAEPMKENIKPVYFNFIESIKQQLDAIEFSTINNEINIPEEELNS
ncbi:murein DD-endopeptidase MepM/ murein hydrolase activator NlpD [Lutibacter oceani]|uniref:Murein DD-endopeptidase MepM/ murein hydrolase activator NlpD n=1 Tax=Lutibacter oceani TaxID=1853311 RepID=A0A3D9S059_9FLAO|nr:peptidoglycan DD-metalloendopeptidase family protein [Lutibacter oceani]REE83511.1 murein DD-endopeptidase MepM/ murein hydrolase activator NlpD [Lutibacter oceani]